MHGKHEVRGVQSSGLLMRPRCPLELNSTAQLAKA